MRYVLAGLILLVSVPAIWLAIVSPGLHKRRRPPGKRRRQSEKQKISEYLGTEKPED